MTEVVVQQILLEVQQTALDGLDTRGRFGLPSRMALLCLRIDRKYLDSLHNKVYSADIA
jgi:hypothetical protein